METKERPSISYRLGEKVICNCANKLKPLMMELIGDKTDEYPKFIISLCHDMSDSEEKSNVPASEKNVPEESTISERDVSDDRPQESWAKEAQQEPVTGCVVEEPPSPRQKDEMKDQTPVMQTRLRRRKQMALSAMKEQETEPNHAEPAPTMPQPQLNSRPKRGMAGTSSKTVGKAIIDVDESASEPERRSLRRLAREEASVSVKVERRYHTRSFTIANEAEMKATQAKQTKSSRSQMVLSNKEEHRADPKPAGPGPSRPKRGRHNT